MTDSRVAVITGANTGIGFHCAQTLAERGYRVILVCRNAQKGQDAVASIGRKTQLVVADLGDLAAVRRAAAHILEDTERLDVLVNNAGGHQAERWVTEGGFEATLAINHLGPYLLTRLLLDRLLEGENPRVVFSSSSGHRHSGVNFDNLNLEYGWNVLKAYGRSKLMNLLTAMELHRRFADQGLIASSMHPGTVATDIWGKGGFAAKAVGLFMRPFMLTPEQGADTLSWLAMSEEAADAAGRYYIKRTPTPPAAHATAEAARTLWDTSEGLVGLAVSAR